MFRCIFCNEHDEHTEAQMMYHQMTCPMNKNHLVSGREFQAVKAQVAEIHEFMSGLAGALNNPMIKAMLPPHIRGIIGG